MILLQTSNFSGYNYLNLGTNNTSKLQAYIDRYEKYYLQRLLGVDLANAFMADLANASQDAIYVAIQDPFEIQDTNGTIYTSRGMVDFLCACVAYHFVSDDQARHSVTGVNAKLSEAGNQKSQESAYRFAERRYNESLETVEAIQWYCKTYNSTDYPDYKGQEFKPFYSDLI